MAYPSCQPTCLSAVLDPQHKLYILPCILSGVSLASRIFPAALNLPLWIPSGVSRALYPQLCIHSPALCVRSCASKLCIFSRVSLAQLLISQCVSRALLRSLTCVSRAVYHNPARPSKFMTLLDQITKYKVARQGVKSPAVQRLGSLSLIRPQKGNPVAAQMRSTTASVGTWRSVGRS